MAVSDQPEYNSAPRVDLPTFKYKFSTMKEVTLNRSWLRCIMITLIFFGALVIPTIIALGFWDLVDIEWNIPWWAWLSYAVVFHTLIILFVSLYITTFAYPLSNSLFGNQILRQGNQRYATEF